MRPAQRTTVLICIALACVGLLAVGTGGVAAQNNTTEDVAPYFSDTEEVSTDSWLAGVEPDLSGVVTLVSRTGTYVIGGGGSGVGSALLTGVVVMGIGVGSVARARVGSIAGATLTVGGVFAGSAVGIAPSWMTAVVMFGVGLVLAAVAKRMVS